MTILIVEDEPLAANNLVRQIRAYHPGSEILAIADTVRLAVELLNTYQPDLLFLDIQLSDGMSFEIFQQCEVNCPVIFTTAYDEFAIQAFEHNSLAYLLKPITAEKVRKAFEKIEHMQRALPHPDFSKLLDLLSKPPKNQSHKQNFLVKKGQKLIPVQTDEIAFFLAEDKCIFLINWQGQRFLYPNSLNHLENILDPAAFFRLSRQHLVHRKAISALESYAKGQVAASLLPTGEKIVVSRQQTPLLKEWLQH